ncbi:hypothetical protein [Glycomyces harbinensis]|uniref:Uncharacterized protein n=1 Tax=Glycomyces harbinensis TaxID=58114 RepID=A0A1G6ZNN6_9ACTN|nr:hypothetical protein [Glycomyces harbinensis]SDE03817.1 hypothetical protein SAMN05216270_11196 [Glycomyces harbinensis]
MLIRHRIQQDSLAQGSGSVAWQEETLHRIGLPTGDYPTDAAECPDAVVTISAP